MNKRAILALGATLAMLAGLLMFASSASAVGLPKGHLDSATQSTTHALTVTGWTYDTPRATSTVIVTLYLDGKPEGRTATNVVRSDVNRAFHITGVHGLHLVVHASKWVSTMLIRVTSKATGKSIAVASARVVQATPPGARIIASAKKYYAARVPYRDGGTTTRGFDCSGYTQYVYSEAAVRALPRTAEQQRRAVRHLTRSQLQPGDLIFYLGGGSAYHVAIYAGNGMQYAEATPHDGLRYQKIWSSAVQYGTTWH
jgi:cell wall-associated NlpC family hydrolase